MSVSEVIIDEQALATVSETTLSYAKEYREAVEECLRRLKSRSGDWNDEDFSSLLSAISSFLIDVEGIDAQTKEIRERINNKIKAIHELHNMKI